jgi:metal-dependent hydrolase (beta-lactamase superfamily II)
VRKLEALGLSHGHFDHFENLNSMLRYNRTLLSQRLILKTANTRV